MLFDILHRLNDFYGVVAIVAITPSSLLNNDLVMMIAVVRLTNAHSHFLDY